MGCIVQTVSDDRLAPEGKIYHAGSMAPDSAVKKQITELEVQKPILLHKAQYYFSDDLVLFEVPRRSGTMFRNQEISAEAGFLVVLTGDNITIPGLPMVPAAERMSRKELPACSDLD